MERSILLYVYDLMYGLLKAPGIGGKGLIESLYYIEKVVGATALGKALRKADDEFVGKLAKG